jgi:protein-S-isoprenylcysteine O-methyltransferase Ste14
MPTELVLKVAFLAAFAAVMAVAIRAGRRAKRRHDGSLNQLANEVKGLIAVRAALGIVFYVALAGWLGNFKYEALGTNYRGGVGLYDDHELITSGPYRSMRHPIYAAFIATMLLAGVVSASWLLGISGLLLVSSIAAARIPVEERELSERFGARWSTYRARTGSLVPRFPPTP